MSLDRARLVRGSNFRDERGSFRTPWDRQDPEAPLRPDSLHFSRNESPGTLRGLHFQEAPYAQRKVVTCVKGEAFDVLVDLRPDSPDYLKWNAFSLTDDGHALLVPAGYAHGFLTLAEDTVIAYLIEGAYVPEAARGLRWNDPRLGIQWPREPRVLSTRDAAWPLLSR